LKAPAKRRARAIAPGLLVCAKRALARPALCACLVLAALPLAAQGPGALPVEAAGEIPFVLDAAALLDEAGRAQVYFTLAVPGEALHCAPGPPGEVDRYEVELQLDNLDGSGGLALGRSQRITVPCDRERLEAEEPGRAAHRLLFLNAPWEGQGEGFELRLLDLESTRAGLLYHIQGSHKRGLARGRVPRAEIVEGRGLSGTIHLWDAQEEAFAEGWWGDFLLGRAAEARPAVDPNPGRVYGLRRRTARAYVEAYGLEGEEVRLRALLRSWPDGAVMAERRADGVLPWERTAIVHRLDVDELESGAYELELRVESRRGGGGAWRSAARLQVLWREASWDRTGAELLSEARLLLDEGDLERFAALEPGPREAFLDSLWGDIDGLIGGPLQTGPARALFEERLRAADARFPRLRSGGLSDRSRVLIRYGEPDEFHKELAPTDETLLGSFLGREIGDAERSETGGARRRTRHDDSAYEVWYYMNRGSPLVPDRGGRRGPQTLKFIFADRMRTGEYRLIYTNTLEGRD